MSEEKRSIGKQYISSFDDYRKFIEKTKKMKIEPGKLLFPKKLAEFVLADIFLDFDATG